MKNTTTATLAAALALSAGSIVCAPASAQEQPVRYDGHRSVRVTVKNARELMTVRNLADDILTCEGSGIGGFDIRLSPERYEAFLKTGIRHTVLIPDIQAHVDQIWADDARIRAGDDPAWFSTYRSLAEIEARMQHYATTYPELATLSNLGTSIQGRTIKMLRITGPGATTNRPAFVIQANQHAREWVTIHSAMYIIDRFCETYATDPQIAGIVNGIDFYIIPTLNPDGYEYSRTTNSQWRKNRRDILTSTCFGVDLNRNWGFQWGFDNEGSSGSACQETYRGTAAWSEPELAGVKSLVDSLAGEGRMEVHWDIHANAGMILSPWGYTINPPAALPLMNTLGAIIQTGMRSVINSPYPYGQGSVILYLNNGNTRDYSYGVHGAQAWTIEMEGPSFQPPVSALLNTCREALAGLVPLAQYYAPAVPPCYANCDGSTTAPVLNVSDFVCFNNKYAAGDTTANCDNSTVPPILNVSDFTCFLNKYSAGCS
jgi:hypothetical protein